MGTVRRADDGDVIIDGLPVPSVLLNAVRQGRWVAPDRSSSTYRDVFGDDAVVPQFLPLSRMTANRRWLDDMPEDYRGFYLGQPDRQRPPGDVDPDQSLLIGDLGPDQPFALDYRPSLAAPSVIYLSTTADWIEVAPNIETLIERLGI
ncbi:MULTISPECIES: SMI1/KNR4 family protein [unclassified Micromonospora]|uniref:SMI1/KNR4 family protein n=1 Tax=unclassified Micromonospora TaxID=2617518 RepID=UPI0022B73112|nr:MULTISPECIES: SMI1/KNR4 family protein [unclassified Micromonospora]MCZ7423684.1 SMI1/KNR4 family protein [Verrucosispora sp. WMMA2121]WBB91372.1 SMI1/KNR4 family protein [Verrucosispora sp. WMMC514]